MRRSHHAGSHESYETEAARRTTRLRGFTSENIDAITDVKGITALSIGLSDLSGSLGVPGQANHPSVQAAVVTLMSAAARKGIPVGLSVRSVEEVRDALKKGARLASVGTLETVLYQALKGWRQNVTK